MGGGRREGDPRLPFVLFLSPGSRMHAFLVYSLAIQARPHIRGKYQC